MSKGNIYCIVLLLLSAILSSAHTIKAATTFQAVNNNEGLCKYIPLLRNISLRSRRLEVVGRRKHGRARRRHARGEEASSPLACLPRARPFSLSPTTSKRLLRRLKEHRKPSKVKNNRCNCTVFKI